MIDSKRGQITVFIVVGIVILFAVGFALYIATIRPQLNIFAPRESEIEQYIGTCLESTGKDAISAIGITGGYLTIPDVIAITQKSSLSFGFNTNEEPKIPLWYYRGQPRIPSKMSIALSIANYTRDNIDTCLGNFDAFKDRFEFRKTGNTTVSAIITPDSVSFELNYPLETREKLTGTLTETNPVSRSLDVKLGTMYDEAVDILKSETSQMFFENLTINWLSSSNDFPFTDLEFTCVPKTWRKSQLISFAKNMIYYNVQQVNVKGNPFPAYQPLDAFARRNYVFPLSQTYPGIGILFFYPRESWFELHVRPNDREVFRSQVARPLGQGALAVVPICFNTWHFTYDINYPLMTTLRDNSAFGGQGFTFNFAFPVTINHNQGDKTDFPLQLFESPEFNYDYCQNTADKTVEIKVKDYFTFEELYQAPVEFRCIKYSCSLGNTVSDGGAYRLNTKIPSGCVGGLLYSHPDGYLEGFTQYQNTDNVDILVKPLKTFKVNMVKHDSNNLPRAKPLDDVDSVSMTITSLTDAGFEQTYLTNVTSNEIQLVYGEGTYYIEAILLQSNQQILGGYIGNWTVSYSDMAGKSNITFHMLENVPTPITDEEQANAFMRLYNTTYQMKLRPTFG